MRQLAGLLLVLVAFHGVALAQPIPPTRPPVADVATLAAPRMLDGRHLIITVPIASARAAQTRLDELASRHPIERVTLWPLTSVGLHCLVARVEESASVTETVAALLEEDDVRTVEPVQAYTLRGAAGWTDTLFSNQQALTLMGVPEAHAVSTGRSARVAVIDTAIDRSHPDLSGRIVLARDFIIDFPRPAEHHGTAVAGVLAAAAGNGEGIVGVAPDAQVLALRACWEEDSGGVCTSFSLARALNVAIIQEVDVINLSLGGPADPLLTILVRAAIARDIAVVAAYGEAPFPSGIDGVITADLSDVKTDPGRVPAPGTDVLTTTPGGRYGFSSGASMSAAHVSGVIALMKAEVPDAPLDAIKQSIDAALMATPASMRLLNACRAMASIINISQYC